MKRWIWISGGTRGIGLATALHFCDRGDRVMIFARNFPDLNRYPTIVPHLESKSLLYQQMDLADLDKTAVQLESFLNLYGAPDILVNNVGIFDQRPFLLEDSVFFERIWRVNFLAPRLITQTIGSKMVQRGQGKIIFVGSLASEIGYKDSSAYVISKHALLGLARCLSLEWKEHGIQVSSVLPGPTLTSSWDGAKVIADKLIDAEDIARLIYSISETTTRSVVDCVRIKPAQDF